MEGGGASQVLSCQKLGMETVSTMLKELKTYFEIIFDVGHLKC